MLTSRINLLEKLQQLEKKWHYHQQNANDFKHHLLNKVYEYRLGLSHLLLPAFLGGWIFARIRNKFLKIGAHHIARFALLSALSQIKQPKPHLLKKSRPH